MRSEIQTSPIKTTAIWKGILYHSEVPPLHRVEKLHSLDFEAARKVEGICLQAKYLSPVQRGDLTCHRLGTGIWKGSITAKTTSSPDQKLVDITVILAIDTFQHFKTFAAP